MTRVGVVKDFQQHMSSGEKDQAFNMIADDAIWHSDEIDAPWSGVHQSKENIIKHFANIAGTTLEFSRHTDEFIEHNDLVIEIGSLRCILKKTNKPFDTQYVCLYRVSDNKITYYRIFEDSLKLFRAYYPEKGI